MSVATAVGYLCHLPLESTKVTKTKATKNEATLSESGIKSLDEM